jgi:tetratricopeptide (TPR) repeat protein
MRKAGLAGWSLLLLAAITTACNSDSRQLLERAEAQWRIGNYDDAIRLNVLLYDRDHQGKYAPKALLNIGNIYYLNLRTLKNAVETYKKLASEFPGNPEEFEARKQLAMIYENEIGDLSQALAEYDAILKGDNLDNRPEILFKRANLYFKLEDYDRAWRELRRIEESGSAGSHLADQVCLKLGSINQIRQRYEDAADYFSKVVGSPCRECRRQAILSLTKTYEALYRFDRAIETIQKLDQFPEDNQRVSQEVKRLTAEKQRLDSGGTVNWDRPHPGQRSR